MQFEIPLQVAIQPSVIIAYEVDGLPLSEMLRLVLPGENGNQWIALITSISMSATTIDLNQYLSATQASSNQSPPINSIAQSETPQQEPVQAQPTATPKNETSTEPVPTPANVTQPEQKTAPQQESNPKSSAFPNVVICGVALGATVALVAGSYLAHSRRRNERHS
jgi:outer membrane biosynthesis protein TonB